MTSARWSQPWLYRLLTPDGRQSLHRRLLAFLLVPLMLMLLIDGLVTYAGALVYSNHVHDSDLGDSVMTLAEMLETQDTGDQISPEARFLLEYDPQGHNYFSVSSEKRGLLAGSPKLQPPDNIALAINGPPHLYDARIDHRNVRAASMRMRSSHAADDYLILTVAETLRDRHERAKEILLLSIPAQAMLIAGVFALVWYGVKIGLRVLDPLTWRLAGREHDLAPIGDVDVPVEILPLTRTIDGLFARLRGMLALQDRFIADAAHQLRTPLAGLRVHVERAQSDPSPATVRDALDHIQRLTDRASRTSTQLLALTRAQSPEHAAREDLIDLDRLIPELLGLRIHEALAASIDLGFESEGKPLWIDGDRTTLQELLDNLLDNSLRYAGRGSIVTVAVGCMHGQRPFLSIEDNGPGVPPEFLARLGERFFRVPGSTEQGTGLGLAIVQRIAERHRAQVHFLKGNESGLRVEIVFPSARTSRTEN